MWSVDHACQFFDIIDPRHGAGMSTLLSHYSVICFLSSEFGIFKYRDNHKYKYKYI